MHHRKWSFLGTGGDLTQRFMIEHNALYEDWKKATLEVERLAKESGDLCDAIARLERELEAVKAERDEFAYANTGLAEGLAKVQAQRDEQKRQRDETERQLNEETIKRHELETQLAAHAVIDAPTGVPSLPELVRLYETVRDSREPRSGLPLEHAVAAIRDAVLAGMHPERPKGLPSAEELDRIAEAAFDANDGTQFAATRAILAALAPWLRDPRGWELDVVASDDGKPFYSQAELDWLRSKIRPTFECQECAKLRGRIAAYETRMYSAREELNIGAALEGE